MDPTNVLPTPPPSSTHPPNPSASLGSPPPLRPSTRYQAFDSRTSQPDQDEALCPAKHGPRVRYSVMEEEHDERGSNSTSSAPPPQPDKTKQDGHREPKVPSSKQFPLKLFRMLEDETVTNYVMWSKSGSSNALHIPNTKAFEVNVMPKHFKDMKQWGSFQRQLLNYGFKKQDRGAGKALYVHSGNKFHKGRPDLLPEVLRTANRKKKAFTGQDSSPAQARPTTPIGTTSPQSEGQIDPNAEDQLEHGNEKHKTEIFELKSELERSKARHSAAEDRLQATEGRLQATEDRLQATEGRLQATEHRLLVMENQLIGLVREPDWLSTGNGASNSQIHPGPAGPVLDCGFVFDTPATPAAVSGFPAYQNSSSQSVLNETHFSMEFSMGIPYEPLDPGFSLVRLL